MGYTPRLPLLPEYPIETMNNSFIIPGANLVNNSPESSIYYGNKASANVYVMRGIIAHVMIFRLIIGQLEVAWYTGFTHSFANNLMNVWCVPGTVLSIGDRALKTDKYRYL